MYARTLAILFIELHANVDRPDNPNTTLNYFTNISFVDLTITKAPEHFPIGDLTQVPAAAPCDPVLPLP